MDLLKILGELYAERKRLGRIIETLEGLHGKAPTAPKKRGRKHMDATARRAVSQRMTNYWAARRKQAQDRSEPDAPSAEPSPEVSE